MQALLPFPALLLTSPGGPGVSSGEDLRPPPTHLPVRLAGRHPHPGQPRVSACSRLLHLPPTLAWARPGTTSLLTTLPTPGPPSDATWVNPRLTLLPADPCVPLGSTPLLSPLLCLPRRSSREPRSEGLCWAHPSRLTTSLSASAVPSPEPILGPSLLPLRPPPDLVPHLPLGDCLLAPVNHQRDSFKTSWQRQNFRDSEKTCLPGMFGGGRDEQVELRGFRAATYSAGCRYGGHVSLHLSKPVERTTPGVPLTSAVGDRRWRRGGSGLATAPRVPLRS